MPRLKTQKEFEDELSLKTDKKYILVSKYINSSTKVCIKHLACGNTYLVTPNMILRGRGCPYCFGNHGKRLVAKKQFEENIVKKYGTAFTLLTPYVSRDKYVLVRHAICGNVFKIRPYNLIGEVYGCPFCKEKLRMQNKGKQVISRVKSALGKDYKVLSEYKGSSSKIKVLHKKCNSIFYSNCDDIIYKNVRCHKCSLYFGEYEIKRYLDMHNIFYNSQKSFNDLRDKNKLSYDFFIPNVNMLIEYQGAQHYFPKTFGGISKEKAKRNLEKQRLHDFLKKEYAKEKGYKLVCIPYTFNTREKISSILDLIFYP